LTGLSSMPNVDQSSTALGSKAALAARPYAALRVARSFPASRGATCRMGRKCSTMSRGVTDRAAMAARAEPNSLRFSNARTCLADLMPARSLSDRYCMQSASTLVSGRLRWLAALGVAGEWGLSKPRFSLTSRRGGSRCMAESSLARERAWARADRNVSLLTFEAVSEIKAQRTNAGHASDQSTNTSDDFIIRQPSLNTIFHGLRKLLIAQPSCVHSDSRCRCRSRVGVRSATL
jgi:hypothetical protein